MTTPTHDGLIDALRDRFVADAILGARVVPIAPRSPVKRRVDSKIAQSAPAQAASSPPLAQISPEEHDKRTSALTIIDANEVKSCTKCGLHAGRTHTVFGIGSPAARVMFVGEAPGFNEDQQGIPFVGDAGNLLTKMIEAGMGLRRDDVYICNIIKCRPPNNRTPLPDEILSCKEYLYRQIWIIRPEVIVALGAPASQTLLDTKVGITRLRGRWHEFRVPANSGDSNADDLPPIPLMPTFHPAYLLRSPSEKAKAWEDIQLVMKQLGLPLPRRS